MKRLGFQFQPPSHSLPLVLGNVEAANRLGCCQNARPVKSHQFASFVFYDSYFVVVLRPHILACGGELVSVL